MCSALNTGVCPRSFLQMTGYSAEEVLGHNWCASHACCVEGWGNVETRVGRNGRSSSPELWEATTKVFVPRASSVPSL